MNPFKINYSDLKTVINLADYLAKKYNLRLSVIQYTGSLGYCIKQTTGRSLVKEGCLVVYQTKGERPCTGK